MPLRSNAAAAVIGTPPDAIKLSLRSTPQINHRLEVKREPNGSVVIDDAYNSNPIGFASGRIPSIPANRILLKNMAVVGAFWGAHARRNPGYVAEAQEELAGLYRAGQIRPVVGTTYPLESAPAALRDLANRKVMGKAVLTGM